MTKRILAAAAAALCLSAACAQDWSNLLKQAEDNTAFYETDFSAKYTIKQTKPGRSSSTTEATIYRRDKASKWTILITGPAKEKGKGYLQSDGTVWFFDPADRRFTFSSISDKFQNTNASNADFAPQLYYSAYDVVSAKEEKLGKLDCVLFELKAKEDAKSKVEYQVLKLWVTKADGLVRMKEDYSKNGSQKLRTTVIPSYQSVSTTGRKYSIPVSMTIIDELNGKRIDGKMEQETTTITIASPSFAKVGDNVYTKPYLETMSAR